MKHFAISCFLLISLLSLHAQPLLVGHRGSGYGVENTEEAFRRGAALGYQYVETDIKVTADTRFVLCHDDNLERWGHNLQIANSTLEQLQAVTLTQTRSGVTYTGKLMELGEFLDLCAELDVKPVIELKSATGVSSSDQSNMHALMQTIEAHGFRNKCIILTSMQPCLEWIYEYYPDVNRQLLVSANATGKLLTWCIQYATDVDITNTYCTQEAVDKYHEAGLLVNMWTTNSEDGYVTYAEMGCDFITTDRINAADMPAVTIPTPPQPEYGGTRNYIDLLAHTNILPADEYRFNTAFADYTIAELTNKTIRRVVTHQGLVYVLAVDANKTPTILAFNPQTKQTATISTEGMHMNHYNSDYQYVCSDIQFTACGHLVASNIAKVRYNDSDKFVTFYRWENDAQNLPMGAPLKWLEIPSAGNWTTGYGGETFAYEGDLTNGTLYYSGEAPSEDNKVRFIRADITDSTTTEEHIYYAQPSFINAEVRRKELGNDYRFTLSPNKEQFVITGATDVYTLGEYTFTPAETDENIRKYNDVPSALALSNAITHVGFFKYAGAIYAVVPSPSGAQLIDITHGIENATSIRTTGLTATPVDKDYAAVAYVVVTKDETDNIVKGDIDIVLLQHDKCTLLTTRPVAASIDYPLSNTHNTVYYTISGIEIPTEALSTGIYIRRQGHTATKVIIH